MKELEVYSKKTSHSGLNLLVIQEVNSLDSIPLMSVAIPKELSNYLAGLITRDQAELKIKRATDSLKKKKAKVLKPKK
jgi:hypothetical protein